MFSSSFISIVRQASDDNKEELRAPPQHRELQMLSTRTVCCFFKIKKKVKKLPRVEREVFVSRCLPLVLVCSRDKRHLSSLVFSRDVHTTR